MKTRAEEFAAYRALAGQRRPDVRHMPGAEETLARHNTRSRAEAREFIGSMSAGEHDPGPGDMAICLIYRGGKFIMADNLFGLCHDCSVPIEHARNLPGHLIKLCIFCAAKRMAQ